MKQIAVHVRPTYGSLTIQAEASRLPSDRRHGIYVLGNDNKLWAETCPTDRASGSFSCGYLPLDFDHRGWLGREAANYCRGSHLRQ
jgi:hypothetical protein